MKHISLTVNIFGEKFWWFNMYGVSAVHGYRYHHNNYGPAFIDRECRGWLHHGKFHRLDGPAAEWTSGEKAWYINDVKYDNYLEYLVAVEEYRK